MKTPIIIDTDIGTDCDDLFALAYAVKNPNANVKAISSVLGDPIIRAKIVRKLERMLRVSVPIIAGERCPEESAKKYWTGIEQLALTDEELAEPLERLPYPAYTADTKLICIGPLTNIKKQLDTNPSIRNVRELYVMGSSDLSHNFKADLPAKQKVFAEPWKIYQVTKDISEQICFTRGELETLRTNPLGEFLYESAIRWLDYAKRDRACMYDVLAVSAAIGEPYVKFEQIESNRFLSTEVDTSLKDNLINSIINI